jgi:uncharacterized phage protein (TIGR01671 family)
MREIKFRAWDGKKMLNNVGVHPFIIQALWQDKDNSMKESDDGAYLISPSFTTYHIMQFTGLYDLNGKEVYEGDLLCLWNGSRILEVRWGRVGWVLFGDLFKKLGFPDGDDCSEYHTKSYLRECEVIGNIYENHDLKIKEATT